MTAHQPAGSATAVERVTDYGLGSFNGQPLVLMPMQGECYHRHDHSGHVYGTTFTEDFCRNGWYLRPCRTCWPVSGASGSTEETQP